jgi:hypothetical protein
MLVVVVVDLQATLGVVLQQLLNLVALPVGAALEETEKHQVDLPILVQAVELNS